MYNINIKLNARNSRKKISFITYFVVILNYKRVI